MVKPPPISKVSVPSETDALGFQLVGLNELLVSTLNRFEPSSRFKPGPYFRFWMFCTLPVRPLIFCE